METNEQNGSFDIKALITNLKVEKEEISKSDLIEYIEKNNSDIKEEERQNFLNKLFGEKDIISKDEFNKILKDNMKENKEIKKKFDIVQESNSKENSLIQPKNEIQIPSLKYKVKTSNESNSKTSKQTPKTEFKISKANPQEKKGNNNNIYFLMNGFKKEFFYPQNKISVPNSVRQGNLYSSFTFKPNSLRFQLEKINLDEGKSEYPFEKKDYNIKDPKQRAEYIKYIKSDLKKFEDKKKTLKSSEISESKESFDSLNDLLNKLSLKIKK